MWNCGVWRCGVCGCGELGGVWRSACVWSCIVCGGGGHDVTLWCAWLRVCVEGGLWCVGLW